MRAVGKPAGRAGRTGYEFLRRREGNAAVEFAFVAPLFIWMFVFMIDYGGQVLEAMSLDSAVRSGMEYARQFPEDTTGITSAVTNSAKTSSVSVSVTQSCECTAGTSVSCTAPCAGGESLMKLVTVSATSPYTTIIPYPDFVAPSSLRAEATLRYQ
jgi:Flp pilus assembly protein TadG